MTIVMTGGEPSRPKRKGRTLLRESLSPLRFIELRDFLLVFIDPLKC